MYSPPPLRGRLPLEGKKVLLINRCQPTREIRTSVLESHSVEVHRAEDLSTARFLWQPNTYDLILLEVRRNLPGEALEFCGQIKDASPGQRFAFLVGPPAYLSLTWRSEVRSAETESEQWAETIKCFVAAA